MGPAGPGEVWPGASTDAGEVWPEASADAGEVWPGASADAGEFDRIPGLTSLPRQRPSLTPRGLGNAQTSCFKVSEASERLKQVVSRFPTRRKGSNKLFQDFRGLGRVKQVFGSTIRGMKRASSVRGCSDEASERGIDHPRGGADQRNPVPCWLERRTSFMLAGSTRRRTPPG